MSTYNQFSIQAIEPDLSNKQIIIKTNFKVDASSVDMKSVAYYDYDNSKLAVYKLEVETKNIYIKLNDYPSSGSRYYLKISGIKDALGRKLATNFDDYIKFTEDVRTKVKIISPVSRETYKDRTLDIKLEITAAVHTGVIDYIICNKEEPGALLVIKNPKDHTKQVSLDTVFSVNPKLKDIIVSGRHYVKPKTGDTNNLRYRIEISTDNVFYNKVTTLLCEIPNDYYGNKSEQFIITNDKIITNQDGVAITFNNGLFLNDELELNTTIEREGQLYIRARAELNETVVGDWSEIISFNIYTVSMDSIETNFLEEYLTSSDLFENEDEETAINPTMILSKSEPGTNEGMFYIELNKEVLLKNKVPNKDGYISLGTIFGFGKEVK